MMSLGTSRATSVRLLMPWRGAWTADVEFELDATGVVPSGRLPLTIGEAVFPCTVDDSASGRKGELGASRVIGGGGGWAKTVGPLALHNDAGVVSTAILSLTGAEVGELVTDLAPKRLGVDYVRPEGPASSVLEGSEWYVDGTGVTFVGPRPPRPISPTAIDVLDWDPRQRVAQFSSDEVVWPGSVIVHPEWGVLSVRDAEQTFDDSGATGTAWCHEAPVAKLSLMLDALIRSRSGRAHLERYRYRIFAQGPDGRLLLQSADRDAGIPDVLLIEQWPGLPGVDVVSSQVLPGSEVILGFRNGDPTKPFVDAYQAGTAPPLVVYGAIASCFGAPPPASLPVALAPPIVAALATLADAAKATASAASAIAAVSPVSGSAAAVEAAAAAVSAAAALDAAISVASTQGVSTRLFAGGPS